MPTDTTITRYGSTGANQGFAIVVRPDGPWVRYEDHERALTAAHAALANMPDHTCHVSGDDCGGCEYARERDKRIAAALRERDEARAALARYEADDRRTRRGLPSGSGPW